jgi:hypothetical protein
MAREARLAVTQPYHGAQGELVHDVGDEFPLDADLPEGISVRPVVRDGPERTAPKATPKAPVAAAPGTPKTPLCTSRCWISPARR